MVESPLSRPSVPRLHHWISRFQSAALASMQWLVALGRPTKIVLLVTMDAALSWCAVWIAFSLRLGEWHLWDRPVLEFGAVALGCWLLVSAPRGIYRSVVRFIGSRTILRISSSCLLVMIGLIAVFGLTNIDGVPRTVSVIHPLVFSALLVISRLVLRYILFDLLNQRNLLGQQSRVLIYGAGASGRQLAASLRYEPAMVLHGFVDDDRRLTGQQLDNVRVYHTDRLERLLKRHEIDTVLLAIPALPRVERVRVLGLFEEHHVRVLTLPNVQQIVHGKVSLTDLREIQLLDLLGRDPVPPDPLLMSRTILNKTVMVTGAGGSIGSELCRQIVQLGPARLILVEMTEHALYAIEGELEQLRASAGMTCDIVAELGNVTDEATVDRLFARWSPQTVFHAAAYKHVPMVEKNVIAGLWNNVFGTLRCALAAERCGVSNFILVSTDKAVRPTNVMGASKRVCELILQGLADAGAETNFVMVRFGNVLGSSGSVVPLFEKQIRAGGPVTLTHVEMTRYFMTIPEAAQLVIQAGAMALGGEVYVLDMGEPVRIHDLARTMINLSGLSVRDAANPAGDIEIVETGLRPGEKLYEELLIGADARPTQHERILQARECSIEWGELSRTLGVLETELRKGDGRRALGTLRSLVSEYMPTDSRSADDPVAMNA